MSIVLRYNSKFTNPSVSLACVAAAKKSGLKVEIEDSIEAVRKDQVEIVLPTGDKLKTSDANGARLVARHVSSLGKPSLYGVCDVTASEVDYWIEFSRSFVTKKDAAEQNLASLDKHLSTKDYLVANAVTLADYAVSAALPQVDSGKYPNIAKWTSLLGAEPQKAAKADAKPAADAKTAPAKAAPAKEAKEKGGAPANGAGEENKENAATNFIRQIVQDDLKTGKHKTIITRFPPEPNGFLHLGHAKSICLNFGLAKDFGGRCHLRFDDTNPTKEDQRYIDSIMADVRWLGFDWGEHLYFASDYFQQLYDWAEDLIKKGLAYVDDQTVEQIRATRGDITTPGTASPFRNRSVDENLKLFRAMKDGKFKEGEKVLRAKIDMAHGNMNMRDPVLYRILFAHHPRTGNKWCIYPMYDYAHGQSDSMEAISHSICTLEFELHRPLYEWFQEKLGIKRTRQIEFARLNMTYMLMSKRKLLALVEEGHVVDWNDPRMPTLSGFRRRGYPAAAMRSFCDKVGVAKRDNIIQLELLENCVREELHETAIRRFAVLDPVKVVVTNWEAGKVEYFEGANHPEKPEMGTRKIPFTRTLYIEREDFMETPSAKFYRLAPDQEVRLRFGYWVKCTNVVKGKDGKIEEIHVTYDPLTAGGNNPPDGRKVKATIHWISADHCAKAEVRLYDRLFNGIEPEEPPVGGKDWRDNINPSSLKVVTAFIEPSMTKLKHGDPVQFERLGFFTPDIDHTETKPVFNRTVVVADTFAKETKGPDPEKEAARIAREKAAAERAKKKEDREKKAAEKEKAKAVQA